MHILLLPSWYRTVDKPWRGTFVHDQAVALARSGFQVGVAFVERRSLSSLNVFSLFGSHFQTVLQDDRGIQTALTKGWSTFAQTVSGSLLWSRMMLHAVRAYTDAYGVPDVIHGHAALWGGHAAMKAAEMLDRPYVVTEHSSAILTNNISERERRYVADVYGNASAVIAVSERLKKSVNAVSSGSATAVIPNTVDTGFFTPPRRGRGRQPFTFLAVCDLVSYKRIDLLISAFVRLHIAIPDTRLIIVGTGKDARRMGGLVRSLDAERSIHFTGALPRWNVRQYMRTANALVLSSDYETFSVVLIEALASGLPVIATRCGGPEEIVTSGTGLLVDRDDDEALREAMAEMLGRQFDPAALHDSARRRFGHDAVAGRLAQIYAAIATERREITSQRRYIA